jgi:hypothetical protein
MESSLDSVFSGDNMLKAADKLNILKCYGSSLGEYIFVVRKETKIEKYVFANYVFDSRLLK